ncbi:MAG: DMT family transporter [Planctomycetota bacterium]
MNQTIAIAAGLFAAATWAVASLLFARFLRDHVCERPPSPAGANLFKNTIACLTFCALWPFFGGALPAGEVIFWLLISGLLGFTLGDGFYLAALPRCGVQTAAMVGQLNVPLAALLGYWFANEPLQGTTLAAMGLTMAGVLLVISDPVTARGEGRHKAFKAGVTFALLNAVTIASGIFVGHVGIKDLEIVPGAVVRLLGGMCGAFLFAPLWGSIARLLGDRSTSAAVELRGLVEPVHRRSFWKPLLTASFAGSVLGLLPYHIALRDLPGGVAAVMFATTPLFTLPLGYLFHERFGTRSVLGTVLGFAGVAGVIFSLPSAT